MTRPNFKMSGESLMFPLLVWCGAHPLLQTRRPTEPRYGRYRQCACCSAALVHQSSFDQLLRQAANGNGKLQLWVLGCHNSMQGTRSSGFRRDVARRIGREATAVPVRINCRGDDKVGPTIARRSGLRVRDARARRINHAALQFQPSFNARMRTSRIGPQFSPGRRSLQMRASRPRPGEYCQAACSRC
jgi:hypothetical protein